MSPPDAQPVRHAIDIVEPTRNEVYLQDRSIIKADRSQSFNILRRYPRRMARQLGGVIEHGPIGVAQGSLRVIPGQLPGEFRVKRHDAEKLGMTLPSVKAAVDR